MFTKMSSKCFIHQGKILKDNTTFDKNKVVENSFIVIMLSKVENESYVILIFFRSMVSFEIVCLLNIGS